MNNVLTVAQHGAVWSQTEWLFGVLMTIAYGHFGSIGTFIFLLPVLLGQAILLALIAARSGRIPSIMLVLAGSYTMTVMMSPRPQLFSYLFFAFGVWAVWTTRATWQSLVGRKVVWPVWTFALLTLLWAQLHASAFLAPGLILGAWVFARSRDERKFYTLPFLVSLILSVLHPGGGGSSTSFISTVFNPGILNTISEWMSPNFHAYPGDILLPWIVIAVPLAVHWALKKKDYMATAWVVAGAATTLFAIRFSPYLVIGLLMVLSSYWPEGIIRDKLPLVTTVTAATMAAVIFIFMALEPQIYPNREPVFAISYISRHDKTGVFTYYDLGDAFDLYGPPPFVDGRAELWVNTKWWPAYVNMTEGAAPVTRFVARYDASARYIIWPLGTPGAANLEASNTWKLVFRSTESIVGLPRWVGVWARGGA